MTLDALSPLDGRYHSETSPLAAYFSERALIRERALVELAWLKTLAPMFSFSADLDLSPLAELEKEIAENPESGMAEAVKRREQTTRHDIKALEYYLHEELRRRGLAALAPLVHFACTSWDINNIAWGRMIRGALQSVMLPQLRLLAGSISERAAEFAGMPMLARTHGQPASPTTVGKEFAVFFDRLSPRLAKLEQWKPRGKMNGASGNYNAHYIARPDVDWLAVSQNFVESQGMHFAARTTQIEPYDDLADLFDGLRRINIILLDFCRDMWGYIALDYFCQENKSGETGSSTMPHKINPIDFENGEGNIGVANALFLHFSEKLPVSRWQRDLSDSTVLRNIGAAFGNTLLAWRGAVRGLGRLTPNAPRMEADLDANWQILAEAVQTVLRAENASDDAYELLKDFSRGANINRSGLHDFIRGLPLGEDAKARLLSLTPRGYCGAAAPLAGR